MFSIPLMFKHVLSVLASFLLFVSTYSYANTDVHVQDISDFQAMSEQMKKTQVPLLLAFTAEYCHYCRQLENEFLQPMLKSGHYDNRTVIRRLETDSYGSVVDFDGKKIEIDDFANRYRIAVTPTVIFLDHNGREIAERLVGINTPEMYGGYLDISIDDAGEEVKKLLAK